MDIIQRIKNLFADKDKRVEQFYDSLPKHIVPLYKAQPPFMEFEGGHGYQGVLLYDEKKDLVQCHLCGQWKRSLYAHLRVHHITQRAYKEKTGLYIRAQLCSVSTANKFKSCGNIKLLSISKEQIKKMQLGFVKWRKNNSQFDLSQQRIAFKNSKMTCNAQLGYRIKLIEKKLGRQPTKHDVPFHMTLRRRFGSFNKAMAHYGYQPRPKNQPPHHSSL